MLSQNTQDSIKQSLFTTAMANPTMNVKPMAGISARPGAGARNPKTPKERKIVYLDGY